MDDMTNTAVWFVMALLIVNIVFAWFSLVDSSPGQVFALKVSPDDPVANLQSCSDTMASGHQGASALATDVTNSYTCGVNPIFALVGGWQIALANVFNGGIFGVPLIPGTEASSLGALYRNILMPIFFILQALAIIDIAYRIAIALSSAASALITAGSAIGNGILSFIGGLI